MNEFRELSDLPPAPRRTPTWVLWMMATVILAGSLIWSQPPDKRLAATQLTKATAEQGTAARGSVPATASNRPLGR
jgi:hypothetical protein